ncbi:hypothetical protein PFLUV_G00007370 [Perca fluviatilis]|uniref:Uncharacterized protein n=1 Tax=Perca fluviatilis TaxID=8168 RepID=A0A6A5FHC2_PERFL|nr:hypothetical protein PFLUV_G00007370 [Perca fluviatilis]
MLVYLLQEYRTGKRMRDAETTDEDVVILCPRGCCEKSPGSSPGKLCLISSSTETQRRGLGCPNSTEHWSATPTAQASDWDGASSD